MAALCLVAACNGTPDGDGAADAPVEILEGSASDAMLPLDSVRSQAPLAEPVARSAGTEGGASGDDVPGEEADEAPAAAPEDEAAE